jgi:acetyl esterase/lipase
MHALERRLVALTGVVALALALAGGVSGRSPTGDPDDPAAGSRATPDAASVAPVAPGPCAADERGDPVSSPGTSLTPSGVEPAGECPSVKVVKPGPIRQRKDVPFMRRVRCAEFARGCVNVADIYYPRNSGDWPTVITVHGRPRTPADMEELAEALARRGAVVYNIDYRGVRPISKGFPQAINDVACAVRFARQTTRRYGGDPDHVVLVGHSQGGYVSALVALAGDEFPGRRRDCLADGGDPLPEGLVHLAGVSTVDPDEPNDLDHIWFGGSQERKADAWRRGDIFQQLGGNPELVVGIIFERHDPVVQDVDARYLHLALITAGYEATITELLEGRTHFDVLDLDRRVGRKAFRHVWDTVRRSDPDRVVESDPGTEGGTIRLERVF